MLFPNWSQFITSHPFRDELSTKAADLMGIPNSDPDTMVCASKLVLCPSSLVLMLDAFDTSIRALFMFHLEGSPFSGPQRCFGLEGSTNQATVLEVKTSRLFEKTSDAIKCPSLGEFMAYVDKSVEDLKELQGSSAEAHHINVIAVLPPILCDRFLGPIQSTNPLQVLYNFIQQIHALKPEDSADEDVSFATHFYPVLLTLWAFTQPVELRGNNVFCNVRNPTDSRSREWGDMVHRQHISRGDQAVPIRQAPQAGDGSTDSSTLAISRLAEAMEIQNNRQNSLAYKDEDKDDEDSPSTGIKAWKKLDIMFRNLILRASSVDGFSQPDQPSDRFLNILSTKNGMATARLFHSWHGSDMICQPGMATNICKGNFTSVPDEFSVNTFSPMFTPPHRAGFSQLSNDEMNSLEFQIQSHNLSSSDVSKMTATKIYVATDPVLYEAQLKNFFLIVCDLFGDQSVLATNLKELLDHYKGNPLFYYNVFRDYGGEPLAAWLLNMVHYKSQKFFKVCRDADAVDDINFNICSFSREIEDLENLKIQMTTPRWYQAILDERTRKSSSNPSNRDGGGNGNRGYNKDRAHGGGGSPSDTDRGSRIVNRNQDVELKLKTGESYSQMVNRNNLTRIKDKLVFFAGKSVCNNYQIRGYCMSRCERAASHKTLTGETLKDYRKYVRAMRMDTERSSSHSKKRSLEDSNTDDVNNTTGDTSAQPANKRSDKGEDTP